MKINLNLALMCGLLQLPTVIGAPFNDFLPSSSTSESHSISATRTGKRASNIHVSRPSSSAVPELSTVTSRGASTLSGAASGLSTSTGHGSGPSSGATSTQTKSFTGTSSTSTSVIILPSLTTQLATLTITEDHITATATFSTTAINIPGLTTNSVTSTTINNSPTILPIWHCIFSCGGGNGIIVFPIGPLPPIPIPILPPPAGYPPLGIGPDGGPVPVPVPENADSTTKKSSSTTSSTSTSSSLTPSASATSYVLLTKKGTSEQELTDLLEGIPKNDVKGRTSFDELELQQVIIDLNATMVLKLGANPIVNVITPDEIAVQIDGGYYDDTNVDSSSSQKRGLAEDREADLRKRDDKNPLSGRFPEQQFQNTSPTQPHLQLISTNERAEENFNGYVQDIRAGAGSYVYVLDSGFTYSDEFKGVDVESFSVVGEETGDTDGHGTSVAALAVGQTFGVAPKASLVTIKISSEGGKLKFSDAEKGIFFAIEHIKKSGRQNKAVINLSSEFPKNECNDWKPIFNVLASENIVLVNAVGNVNTGSKIPGTDSFDKVDNIPTPASCNSNDIIVVGATYVGRLPNAVHKRLTSSRDGGKVDFWAPGNIANCPTNSGTKYQAGTSFAAPQVAGLIAYFYSLSEINDLTGVSGGERLSKIKTLLSQLQYQRTSGLKAEAEDTTSNLRRPEIWNGIVGECGSGSNFGLSARDGSLACTRSSSTSGTATATSASMSGISATTYTTASGATSDPGTGTSGSGTSTSTGTTASGKSTGTRTSGSETSKSTGTGTSASETLMTTSSSTKTTSTQSITDVPKATTTKHVPGAQTVTSNGMICVLYAGSNDPVCQPEATPTANPSGTNLHINSGCCLVNGSPRCSDNAGTIAEVYQSLYNVAANPAQPYSTALILSGFNFANQSAEQVPGCQLNARWPSNYGDVYFGKDGCLYDSGSNQIFDQCCSAPDTNNRGPVINPYHDPRPVTIQPVMAGPEKGPDESWTTTSTTTTSTSKSTPTTNPNAAGTNLHINAGCVLVNDSPRCAGNVKTTITNVYQSSYNIAADPTKSTSSVVILAGFNSKDYTHKQQKATCQLNAVWPSGYGDIYFGADGCLYDGGGSSISNQCCSGDALASQNPVTNPYHDPRTVVVPDGTDWAR